MRYLALTLTAITLVSCNRDPNYLKQKYLESGNRYYEAKRLKEASIMYRKSIEKDRKFGPAYYKLALVSLDQGQAANAVNPLRRAVELLKPGTPEWDDANLKLAEIMIIGVQANSKNASLRQEIDSIADALSKQNPNGWQGLKLKGDISVLTVSTLLREQKPQDARLELARGIASYRAALSAKPGDPIISLALARVLVLAGESPEAENIYKTLLAKDKKNGGALSDLYRLYVGTKRLPEAEALLKQAVVDNPKEGSLRLQLAQFYYGTNKRTELVALLDTMKKDLKDFPDAYINAGDFYQRVGQFDEAQKQYEEGIKANPQRKKVYLKHQVETLVRQGRLQDAYAKNEDVLKEDPKDPEARGVKASFMLDKGEINAAMTELQSVVTASPQNFMARFNLGRAHFARGEYEQARQDFDQAIAQRPDYMPARLAQTQVALMRGDFEAALRSADETLKISPGSIQGRVMKAGALQRLNKYDEARALLEEVLKTNPNQVDTLLELGVLNLNQKKNKDAQEFFRRAYTAAPSNIRGLMGESRALLLDGQTEKSVEIIKAEAEKSPDRFDLQRELGSAQMAAGQFDASIETFKGQIGKVKDNKEKADLWFRMGQSYRFRGDSQKAIDAFEQARQLVPDSVPINSTLAMTYDAAGRKDMARKYYEATIKLNPNDTTALNNLAYLLAESNGNLDEALTYATRAKQRMPNFAEITDTLGWIYLKKNLTDSAVDTFKTLVTQQPQNPTYHYHYAMALSQKGDRVNAKKEAEAALANRPPRAQESDIKALLAKLS
jgi:tetratricopeptide (TPR) repeat protein